MWHVEEVDVPGFKGEFLVKGETVETAQFMGMQAAANQLNALETERENLRAALIQWHTTFGDPVSMDSCGCETCALLSNSLVVA